MEDDVRTLSQDCDSIPPDIGAPLSSDCSLICEFDPLIRCNANLADKVGSIANAMSLWPGCVQAMQTQWYRSSYCINTQDSNVLACRVLIYKIIFKLPYTDTPPAHGRGTTKASTSLPQACSRQSKADKTHKSKGSDASKGNAQTDSMSPSLWLVASRW
jgi:hypothetical protein